MAKHIISTLSRDTRYADWRDNAGLKGVGHSVLVKGGAGITPRLIGGRAFMSTPKGVRTEVSDSDADFLANHPHFQRHQKRGFVQIVNAAIDPESVAKSMNLDDPSRPKTPEDVKKSQPPKQEDAEKLTVAVNKK